MTKKRNAKLRRLWCLKNQYGNLLTWSIAYSRRESTKAYFRGIGEPEGDGSLKSLRDAKWSKNHVCVRVTVTEE